MALSEKEKEDLHLECLNAKLRCREAHQVLQQLEKFATSYWRIHDLWRERFERADRKLAEEERLSVYRLEKGGRKKSFTSTLTKDELLGLIEEIEKR